MSLEEQRAKSLGLWDDMAAGWQTYNDYIWDVSRKVGEWLVEKLEPQPGQTILDVAAGPGDTGFVAARLIGESGRLISTDFAPHMVEVAKGRAESVGVGNVDFKVMDAEDMDLADDSVDGVLCRWGLMLMVDPGKALTEMNRVVRDGGRIAFSVWGGPELNPWVTLTGMVMTQRGYPPGGDPFAPGGMFSMSDEDRIAPLLKEAGLEAQETERMSVTWRFTDFDDFWKFVTELAGAVSALIRTLPDHEIAGLKDDLKTALEAFRVEDGYAFPGETINVLAS
jgi:SAM-dependent methyltransferase